MESVVSAALTGFAVGMAVQRCLDKLLRAREIRHH